jgi:hypothetical protein
MPLEAGAGCPEWMPMPEKEGSLSAAPVVRRTVLWCLALLGSVALAYAVLAVVLGRVLKREHAQARPRA